MTMSFSGRAISAGAAICAAFFMSGAASAEEVVTRLALPDNNPFPISAEVTVNAGADIYFLSGAVPPMINKDAPKGSTAAYGDMETQTTNALTAIKGTL